MCACVFVSQVTLCGCIPAVWQMSGRRKTTNRLLNPKWIEVRISTRPEFFYPWTRVGEREWQALVLHDIRQSTNILEHILIVVVCLYTHTYLPLYSVYIFRHIHMALWVYAAETSVGVCFDCWSKIIKKKKKKIFLRLQLLFLFCFSFVVWLSGKTIGNRMGIN